MAIKNEKYNLDLKVRDSVNLDINNWLVLLNCNVQSRYKILKLMNALDFQQEK